MQIYLLTGLPNSTLTSSQQSGLPYSSQNDVYKLKSDQITSLLKTPQLLPTSFTVKSTMANNIATPATSLISSLLMFPPVYCLPTTLRSLFINGLITFLPKKTHIPHSFQVSAPVSGLPCSCFSLVPHPTSLFCTALII